MSLIGLKKDTSFFLTNWPVVVMEGNFRLFTLLLAKNKAKRTNEDIIEPHKYDLTPSNISSHGIPAQWNLSSFVPRHKHNRPNNIRSLALYTPPGLARCDAFCCYYILSSLSPVNTKSHNFTKVVDRRRPVPLSNIHRLWFWSYVPYVCDQTMGRAWHL